MTVRELIIKLLDENMDAVVLVPMSNDDGGRLRTPQLLGGFATDGGFTNPHDWAFDAQHAPDGSYVEAVVLIEEVY